jgi:Ca2+-binding RTX toxin-like protein
VNWRGWGIAAGLALLGSALVAQAVAAPSPNPETPRCGGQLATIIGTDGDDVLHGTPERDVIWGGRGDDVIHGAGGNDVICGGPGDDVIYGERGNDRIFGGPGEDRLYGGHGDDRILGGGGGDFIHGGLGIDILDGGPGDDTVDGGYGWDVLDGGPGDDTVSFASAARSNHEGGGVRVSLRTGRATGDGRDRLRRFENVVGSAFDDVLIGKRHSRLHGGPGDDRCRGVPPARRSSCGRQRGPRAPVHVHFDTGLPDLRAAGIVVSAGGGDDDISLAFDARAALLSITAKSGIAIHDGCRRPGSALNEAVCPLGEAPRWVTVDLGPGDDRFRVLGSLRGVGEVRVAGGPGDDVLRGGGEDSLLEGGLGADRLYGGAGSDALVAGRAGGPNFLHGGPDGNLLASGPPCAGGRIVGGSGSDNVSFAELPIQPGVLVASLRRGIAYVEGVRGCRPVRISGSVENLEGSFGPDILVGDRRANNILGQPGADRIYGGGGGDDFIDARDGGRDAHIQCGARGSGRGLAMIDHGDPAPRNCGRVQVGKPIPGLPK